VLGKDGHHSCERRQQESGDFAHHKGSRCQIAL
jgi:hypothetical protein